MYYNVYKKKYTLGKWILITLRNIFIAVVLTFLLSMATGYQYLNVLTASMDPTLPVGTIVAVHKVDQDELKVGDIITVSRSGEINVTHRIYKINEDGTFVTKGDNNDIPDAVSYKYTEVVGRVEYYFPHLGTFFNMLKEPLNLIFIVIGLGLGFFIFQM